MRNRDMLKVSAMTMLTLAALAWLSAPPASAEEPRPGVDWPQFRGIGASGISEGTPLPITWDVPRGENLRWKTPIPGMSHASPIVWGDRVFVVTAVSGQDNPSLKVGLYGNVDSVDDSTVHRWFMYGLDKNTGKILWEQLLHEGAPSVKRHAKATQANSTPATNGKVVVTFYGSEGLCCLSVDGKMLWKKNIGNLSTGWFVPPQPQWGFGSSPIIFEDMVIVQCDVLHDAFIAAFRLDTGEEVWRTKREEVPTWGTPTLWRAGGRSQIVVNGYQRLAGYDPRDGRELWWMSAGGDIPVPTPVAGDDLIYVANAHGFAAPIYAIRPTASGNISLSKDEKSNEHIAWCDRACGNYMQTPLLYLGGLYCCRDNGVLTCYDPKTGEQRYRQRLGKGTTGFTASPVAGDGKLYLTSEEGDVYVVRAGPTFELLASNAIGEICLATPAISQGALFFRTQHHLLSIAAVSGNSGK